MKLDIRKYLLLYIILVITIPRIDLFKPFHISFILIPGLFWFYKPSVKYIHYTLMFLAMALISIILCLILKFEYFSLRMTYQLFFVFLLLLFFDIGNKIKIDMKSFFKLVFIINLILVFLILNQMLFHIDFISNIYLSQLSKRNIDALNHYLIILYPFENSNSAAILFSFFILLTEMIIWRKKNEFSKKVKIFNIIIIVILLIGVILSYARTVLAAFVFSQLFVFRKKILKLIPFILLFGIIIFFIVKDDLDRNLNYYFTIFNFTEDNSFTSRFVFWENIFKIMKNNLVFVFTGVPFYKKELANLQTGEVTTVIDSNYLYILIKTGIIGFAFFLFSATKLFFKNKNLQGIICFLFIASITLAFLDDYRFAIVIGVFIGLINNNFNDK